MDMAMAAVTPLPRPKPDGVVGPRENLLALAAEFILLNAPLSDDLRTAQEEIRRLMVQGREIGLTDRDIAYGLLRPLFVPARQRYNCPTCLTQ